MKRIEAKYAVIGLGVLGTSVLKELLEEGERDIVVIEKESTFGGATAHSFGTLRVFHDSLTLTDLAHKSYKIAVKSAEGKISEKRPFLSIREKSPKLSLQIKNLQKKDYAIDVLSPTQVEKTYGIKTLSTEVGVLESESLTFDPHDLMSCYHQALLPQVTCVRDDVCCLIENKNSVDIINNNGNSIRAAKVLIAAGVGSIPLLSGRGSIFKPKLIEYNVSSQQMKGLPQLLNAQTREFISQRKNKSYHRFTDKNLFLKELNLTIEKTGAAYDISSEISQESFGGLPGSRGIFFMGAWNGNAFKLSWQLSKLISECLLSKNTTFKPLQGTGNENFKLL